MTAEGIVAIVMPAGVLIGWLTKHFQNGAKPTGHQARVETLLASIEKHTADIPLLRHVMEAHESATARAREQVGRLEADMESRQRRGE